MTRPRIGGISPCFIVKSIRDTLAFYRDQLDFEVTFQQPEQDPFFAIVMRDGAMFFLKSVDVDPVPNRSRHPWGGWDAYVYVPDPDALAAEFSSRGVAFSEPLKITSDQLRGFELKDPNGYVLFFGRPEPGDESVSE